MSTVALARVYQQSFNTRPNITLALTGGCLNALGDIVAQVAQNAVSYFNVTDPSLDLDTLTDGPSTREI